MTGLRSRRAPHVTLSAFTTLAALTLAGLACSGPGDAAQGASTSALGTSWASDRVFPTFSAPATLDVVTSSGQSAESMTLMVTLQGLVNRTTPRIYVLDNSDSSRLWLRELGGGASPIGDPFALIAKYRSEIAGIVIYDDAQADTLNLATTMASLKGGVVSSPAFATRLTAAPYSLPMLADLRQNHFTSNVAVYQYELDNFASAASHRLIVGLTPGIPGNLRDYAMATNAMMVWLDPRKGNEKALLDKFFALLAPNSPYLGWWSDEPSGVAEASRYGVPVYAADWSSNLTVLGGAPAKLAAPHAPAPPVLENKVYVAIFMSDGDNLQEDQGLVPLKWADRNRGNVPIGWTLNPALVDVAPTILSYFQRTATTNDVLVSGPSGLGYTYPAAWPQGIFEQYAKVSGQYMDRAGFRVATVWNNGTDLSDANALAYVRNVPNLLGLTIQDSSKAVSYMDGRIPLVRLNISYGDTEAILEGGIDRELANYKGNAPLFITVQGNMNMGTINPTAFFNTQERYASNSNVVFVRPDHFFQLMDAANRPADHKLLEGDFNGDGKSDEAFYYGGNGDFWFGLSDGTRLTWSPAGNGKSLGALLDAKHTFYTGDFNGDGKTDIAFLDDGSGAIWTGLSDGAKLNWHKATDVGGFGKLLDGAHCVYLGDFNGDRKTDILFYYKGDGNLWLGTSDGTTFSWHIAANAAGFQSLLDGQHEMLIGDFNGDGKSDVTFYYSGDGFFWMGLSDGNQLAWHAASDTHGFGNLLNDGHKLTTGDFDGDGKTDIAFYYDGDGTFWVGSSNGQNLNWHSAGQAPGFGNLLDLDHRMLIADYDGDRKTDVLFYSATTGALQLGLSNAQNGQSLAWRSAGNINGFGNLLDPSRRIFNGDFDGDGKADLLFHYAGDANWWLGASTGQTLDFHLAGNTAGFGNLLR